MASVKTINFLPSIFRTDTNQKFLNATLDQLVTPPDLRKVNAYVGRKFAPTFKSTDNYQPEPSTLRQNYQLEPSVVVKDKSNNLSFFSSYIDLLNQIKHYGGIVDNHDRLFTNESYSFDGFFDFDKLVNFNQYYWLANGLDAVTITGGQIPATNTFTVIRDPASNSYQFSGLEYVENPALRLAHGGTYRFIINQPGFPFWLQSEAGVSGLKANQANFSSRNVYGVENNGIDQGIITFTVPQPSSQDVYLNMSIATSVDTGVTLRYTQVQGQTLSSIIAAGGLDGNIDNPLGKTLVFLNSDIDDLFWYDSLSDTTIPIEQRRNAYIVRYVDPLAADPIINLQSITTVLPNQRVFVKGGSTHAEYFYYLDSSFYTYKQVPDITAPLSVIFYQDGKEEGFNGAIHLVDVTYTGVNVTDDILGRANYESPNGVTFTNGLTVTFDSSAIPSSFINKKYYVEGVGSAIKLLPITNFQTPEAYAADGLITPDYLTINRASQDLNPWSRSNRWFHIDVITATAAYNNTIPLLDQNLRAKRAIIEFESDLKLFNFGVKAKTPIDVIDFTTTDARSNIELSSSYTLPDNTTLKDGMRIIFANDIDPTVRNQIYVVTIATINYNTIINLTPADDSAILPGNNVIVLQGSNKALEYFFDGTNWNIGQQKTLVNQPPLFEVFDTAGYSLADTNMYPNSTFSGTKIFSYQRGTGIDDIVLGFPLSYRNLNQIGDIQFDNNYDSDIFEYTESPTGNILSKHINIGVVKQNVNIDTATYDSRNIWTTNNEPSRQFQIISGVYDGSNAFFEIDIEPEIESTVPYLRVYINSSQIDNTQYNKTSYGIKNYIQITSPTFIKGDQVDILIYSKMVSKLGYYEIPKNLDFNSENINFESLTLGQLRNHLTTMTSNSNRIVGSVPGISNLRDIPVKSQGGSILQHASPVLYSELFLVDPQVNFIKGIELARNEYSIFKNKILELSTGDVNTSNIPALLDSILQKINSVKNQTCAWYYSDMVPYGDIKTIITYPVYSTDARYRDYAIPNIFNDAEISNIAKLVYVNNVQLIKGKDYIFDTTRAGITINSNYPLNSGDIVTIHEYDNTDGNYIPETPTKLGLYPKFTPGIFQDSTYQTPINVIQGHDGSITPAFGDFRDQLLLEFEKRIYNNIKVDYARNVFDIFNYTPGKFRKQDYTTTEFNQLLTRPFLRWVGSNRVDFTANSYFTASNSFTWNYSRFVDNVNKEQLLGSWRGIYKYFYDTDRPHTHPWEMLGFSEQPLWWVSRYGPAPYTGGNLVLWGDLEVGYIHAGERAGYDSRFARPGLLNIIPVNDYGRLRSPDEFLVANFNSNDANGSFAIGDQGPVETAWRRSSDYPFAVQQALALSRPAFYFGSLVNVGDYYKNTALNQFVFAEYLQRRTIHDYDINGVPDLDDIINGEIHLGRTAGYINWIADYLRYQGIDPGVKITSYTDAAQVQLAYKMAGYSDKSFLNVLAEQSSPTSTNLGIVVPNENYSIELYKTTPIDNIVYSGVIVEKSENGYTVSGYDSDNPFFTIIPSLANNNAFSIKILNDTGVIYQDFQRYKMTVPYGFEFTNKQQVVDFLVSYERYLKAIGIVFPNFDTNLNLQRDFKLSVREFLMWSQQGWATNNIIVLSPLYDSLSVRVDSGVIDEIDNSISGSKLLDVNFNFIRANQFSVIRTDNSFGITSNYGQTIGLAKLTVVEYEHILIFDNVTSFNDVIYKPELGNRQYRLKIVGSKTGSWTGNLNPPGFIFNSTKVDIWASGTDYAKGALVTYKNNYYLALTNLIASDTFTSSQWSQIPQSQIKTGLLPNFSYNAEKFKRFNDVNNPELQGNFNHFSLSTIGFKPRQYLTDFGLDEITQAKFYQGFIREKGSLNSITAFTAAGFNGITSNIGIYEEWGMRVGEYGALSNNKYLEVSLNEGQFTSDPLTITLLANGEITTDNTTGIQTSQLYKYSAGYTPTIYPNRDSTSIYEHDLPHAGYVNLNDIDVTIFDLNNYVGLNSQLNSIGVGYKIWCAKDFTGDWNVYRVSETDINVVSISYNIDVLAVVKVSKPHNFMYGDLVVIKGFDSRIDSIYQVYGVVDTFSFNVILKQNINELQSAKTITGISPIYKLQSLRIQQDTDINSIEPLHNWITNDKLWVDNDEGSGTWAVYRKTDPWSGNVSRFNPSMMLAANSYVTNSGFGTSVTLAENNLFAAAGIPNILRGNVMAFVSNVTNGNVLTLVANLGPHSGNAIGFGTSLTTSGNVLYVGNPGNGISQYGSIHVYTFDRNATFTLSQTISSPSLSNIGDLYGSSVSVSDDGAWLFVGAPHAGNVYIYHGNATSYYTYANTIVGNIVSNVGYTVQTTSDASQTIISAPYENTGAIKSGAVYVYDRSIETFIATGGTGFVANCPVTATLKVLVNGVTQTTGFTSNAIGITFTTAPVVGSHVTLETNKFQLLEKIVPDVPSSGGNFGIVTSISGNDAEIFVASPGYSEPGYYSGIVYRYVNQGATYGNISSDTLYPFVHVGDSIRINGIKVTFGANTTGSLVGNIASIAANIVSANIPGISASTTNGILTLTSNVVIPYQRLVLTPGTGTALANIGLNVYANVQVLKHPGVANEHLYGGQIAVSNDSKTLVVGASGGSTVNPTVFDLNTTILDDNSTDFLDGTAGSGVVYIYGLVGAALSGVAQDQYTLIQSLQNTTVSSQDAFGSSLALNDTTLLIGAPGDSNNITIDPTSELAVTIPNAGTYYTYNNFSSNVGWDIIRSYEPQIDIGSVTRMYLYNNNNNTLLTNFDYIDPAKGKILGIAEQDLNYKTTYDPAIYNAVGGLDSIPNVSYNPDCPWGSDHVGQTWWNLDLVKYINYEQGTIAYRVANWGAQFPGSQIQINEWVESDEPPSQYTGPGVVIYPANDAYCVQSYVDEATKILRAKYYFWVTGKDTVDTVKTNRNSTISTIQDIIINPQAQGIPYAAVSRNDTISLYNVTNRLSGNTTILHVDYDDLKNTNVIHSEFQLVQEGTANGIIPDRIVEKMIDSLTGADILGNPVPDPTLSPQTSVGLGVNPNQSIFVDRDLALANYFEYVNTILKTVPVVETFIIQGLYEADPLPTTSYYDITVNTYLELSYVDITALRGKIGYSVLVLADETQRGRWTIYSYNGKELVLSQTQRYYTPFYWNFENWYASDYDSTVNPTFVVDYYTGLAALSPLVGDSAYVTNRGNGLFAVYRYNSSSTWDLVGIQNGTIQFVNITSAPANTMRTILDTLRNSIFIDVLKPAFNNSFFFLINYVLSEQPSIDWAFKTSFISIIHKLRKLEKFPNYIQDNQTYYESYINEVKPYRTSIREYLLDYQGDDQFSGDVTDFDLPATYNPYVGKYRSPDGSISTDRYTIENSSAYQMWNQYHAGGIKSVISTSKGNGYFLEPEITVIGGGGSGAVIRAIVNYTNGSIEAYQVIKSGSGYTSTPQIFINGTGFGAAAYPILIGNYHVTKIATQDITVNANTAIYAGNIITQPNTNAYGTAVGYSFIQTKLLHLGSNVVVYAGNVITQPQVGGIASGNIIISSSGNIVTIANASISGTFITGANTYIYGGVANLLANIDSVSSSTTANTITIVDVNGSFSTTDYLYSDSANLYVLPTAVNSYINYENDSYNLIRTFNSTLKFDRVSYTSNVVEWTPNATITSGTIISYQGQAYQATSDVYSSAIFTLNGNITATAGQYITQSNNTGNSTVITSVTNGNVVIVSNVSGLYSIRWGNLLIDSAPTSSTTTLLYLESNVTVYAGNVITQSQQEGYAVGVVINSLTGNVIIMDPATVTGKFITGANTYINCDGANLLANVSSVNSYGVTPFTITNVFDKTKYTLLSADSFTNTNDRIMAYYQPSEQMPGKNLKNLISGISYPGVTVRGLTYTEDTNLLDSNISSSFSDTLLGTRAEDIVIDGGAYIDTYSSHAPEELIPGQMVDSLHMFVYTGLQNNTSTVTYSISHNLRTKPETGIKYNVELPTWANNVSSYGNIGYKNWPKYHKVSSANITVLTANLNITDTNVYVASTTGLSTPNAHIIQPGIVYINGEKISYYGIDRVNNVLSSIRRGVDGTGSPLIHQSGTQVIELSDGLLLPGGNLVHTTTWLNTGLSITQNFNDNLDNLIVDNLVPPEYIISQGTIAGTIVDGAGLEGSNTEQAMFIKS